MHDLSRQTGPVLARALADGDVQAVFTALHDELAGSPTTVVVVEDVHWADDASLGALAFPFERAHALADADDEQALLTALELAGRLGADPLAARVRARLRTHGVQRVPRGPGPTPAPTRPVSPHASLMCWGCWAKG